MRYKNSSPYKGGHLFHHLLMKKKKLTKTQIQQKVAFWNKIRSFFWGGCCGFFLAALPLLVLNLTPGHLTREYLPAQILFSSSSGGTSTSALRNLIDTRLNHVTTAPLSLNNNREHRNIIQNQRHLDQYLDTQTSWTAGRMLRDIQLRLAGLSANLNLSQYGAGGQPPPPAPAGPITVSQGVFLPGVYIAQDASNSRSYGALQFYLTSNGNNATLLDLNIRVVTSGGKDASDMISAANILDGSGTPVDAVDIAGDQITFRGLNMDLPNGNTVEFTINVIPRQVVAGGADYGDAFSLELRDNAFQQGNNGLISVQGTSVDPITPGVFGDTFIIQQAAPQIYLTTNQSGSNINSDLLSNNNDEAIGFGVRNLGMGDLALGEGIAGSKISVIVDVSDPHGTLKIDKAEIRELGSGDLLVEKGVNITAGVGSTKQVIEFTSTDFEAGKRLSGGGEYMVYLTVSGVNTNQTLQASIGSLHTGSRDTVFIDNGTSVIDQTFRIDGLPIYSIARISTI